MRRERLGLAAAGLLLLCYGAAPAQTGFNLTGAQTANQQALQGYRWTSRTEVKVNGELVLSTLSLARFDSHGRIQMDQIGGGEKAPSHDVLQGQRSRAEFKKNRLEGRVLEVTAQIRKYDAPAEKQLEAFRRDARRTPGSGDLADTEQWVLQGLIRPDDQVTLWVDRKSGLQRRMEVSSRAGEGRAGVHGRHHLRADQAWAVGARPARDRHSGPESPDRHREFRPRRIRPFPPATRPSVKVQKIDDRAGMRDYRVEAGDYIADQ